MFDFERIFIVHLGTVHELVRKELRVDEKKVDITSGNKWILFIYGLADR